jgi:hypothetical protein
MFGILLLHVSSSGKAPPFFGELPVAKLWRVCDPGGEEDVDGVDFPLLVLQVLPRNSDVGDDILCYQAEKSETELNLVWLQQDLVKRCPL